MANTRRGPLDGLRVVELTDETRPLRRQDAGRERRVGRPHRARRRRAGDGATRPSRPAAGCSTGGSTAASTGSTSTSATRRRRGGLPAPGRARRPGDRDPAARPARRARRRSRRPRRSQPVARAGLAHPVRPHRAAGRLADERPRRRRAGRRAQHLRDARPGRRRVGTPEPQLRLADGVHLRARRRARRPRDRAPGSTSTCRCTR